MRISLNNIRTIEKYLLGAMDQETCFLFEAEIQSDPTLKFNVYVQQKVMSLLRIYHRKKLKAELEVVHQRLFGDPDKHVFKQSIAQLF